MSIARRLAKLVFVAAAAGAALLAARGPASGSWREQATERPLMFVLAGQSNMVGQGVVAELAGDLLRPPPNVDLYLDGERVELGAGPHFGPELSFAQELAAALPDRDIVLVKFAVGGTSLLAWAPEWTAGGAQLTDNAGAGPLYDRLLAYVAAVRDERGGEPAAVLWMQGERDARYPEAGESYGANLEALVDRLRLDLGSAELPFLYGQVDPPLERYPAAAAVRRAQAGAAQRLGHAIMVSTDGLGKRDDELHYDAEGQLELGRRFAAAYLAMTTNR